MSKEFQRPSNKPFIPLKIAGERYEMHEGNAQIYTHTHQEDGDHVFLVHERLKNNKIRATYLWRAAIVPQFGLEKFNRMTTQLKEIGVHETVLQYMDDADENRFKTEFGWTPPKKYAPTERHEAEVTGFMANLSHIVVSNSGLFWDLMTDHNDERDHPRRWC